MLQSYFNQSVNLQILLPNTNQTQNCITEETVTKHYMDPFSANAGVGSIVGNSKSQLPQHCLFSQDAEKLKISDPKQADIILDRYPFLEGKPDFEVPTNTHFYDAIFNVFDDGLRKNPDMKQPVSEQERRSRLLQETFRLSSMIEQAKTAELKAQLQTELDQHLLLNDPQLYSAMRLAVIEKDLKTPREDRFLKKRISELEEEKKRSVEEFDVKAAIKAVEQAIKDDKTKKDKDAVRLIVKGSPIPQERRDALEKMLSAQKKNLKI